MVFKAKMDWWFHAVAGLLCGVTVFLVYRAAVERELVLYVAGGIFLLLMAVLIVPMWVRTCYTLADTCLVVVSGLFTSRILYSNILGVKESRDPGSAPAPSIDRVQIQYRTKDGDSNFMVVSPKEKVAFIREIKEKVKQL